jgi:hypothetical protein
MTEAKNLGAPYELVRQVAEQGQAAGAELRGGRHRHPGRRGAVHGARGRGGLRRLGHLPLRRPRPARAGDRRRHDLLAGREEARRDLAPASARRWAASRSTSSPRHERLAKRGWYGATRSACSRCKAATRPTASTLAESGFVPVEVRTAADLATRRGARVAGRREHDAPQAHRPLRRSRRRSMPSCARATRCSRPAPGSSSRRARQRSGAAELRLGRRRRRAQRVGPAGAQLRGRGDRQRASRAPIHCR